MKIAKNTAQQGDVLFKKADGILIENEVIISKNRCVVAEGEHTGHMHVLESPNAEMFKLGDKMFLKLGSSSTVKHQEHNPITLDKGMWEIGRVQEYDYYQNMKKAVVD